MSLLTVEGLRKAFKSPDGEAQLVLDVPRFALGPRAQVALRGRSGSGKTTLLNVIAGIQKPDAGKIVIEGVEVTSLSEAGRDAFRARHIGYVFQTFHLLQGYTALENVLLGMIFGPGADREFAESLLVELGLGERLRYLPGQLSVGQQQRVALARALANRPKLVLADEPTGNLDAERASEALELLRRLCLEQGAALLCVSHDPTVLESFAERVDLSAINRAAGAGARS
jgi:putative ABC transport system ATP-binding protein